MHRCQVHLRQGGVLEVIMEGIENTTRPFPNWGRKKQERLKNKHQIYSHEFFLAVLGVWFFQQKMWTKNTGQVPFRFRMPCNTMQLPCA